MTQLNRVVGQLEKHGHITRNACLKVRITRLGAIIDELKRRGWEFTAGYYNGDYVYKVISKPRAKKNYYISLPPAYKPQVVEPKTLFNA
jgi:hypothetical protein